MADTLSTIMKYIENQNKKTSVTAVKALRALPHHVFDADVKKSLESVYFQTYRPYDSSARTLALDTLLERQPDDEFITLVLKSLTSKPGSELSTYSLQRLVEFAGNNQVIRSQLRRILASNLSLNNYHVFAQNGMSTAFSRDIYKDVKGNGTFRYSIVFVYVIT